MESKQFSLADYIIFGTNLLLCGAIGVFYALTTRGQATTSHFLMADRQLKVLPLTISLLVSVISAVTLLGLPAEMYSHGSQYFFNIGSGLGIVLTAFIFVPLLHPLKLTSMFEYLERRFQSKAVRMVGSVMEMLALLLYGGTALFAPATALEGVTPLPAWAFASIMGFLVTFYTALGGMKAVIWTDVFQAFIMLAGIIAIIIQGCYKVGGLTEVLDINRRADRLNFYNFDPDPTTRHTFWGLTMGFCMGSLSFYGASQFTFQRFTATKSLRDAKITVLLNLPTFYSFHILLCLVGLIVYAYYDQIACDPIKNKEILSSNQLLPLFVMDVLSFIPGLPGLFVASLTSGALSTISSVLNSVAALVWEDVLKERIRPVSDRTATHLTRLIVCVSGSLVVALTFLASNFGPHIFQVCFAFLGASGGPQLGLFLLGAFIPWANSKGAIVGCLAGITMTTWITVGAFITKPFTPPLPPAPMSGCYANTTSSLATTIMTSTSFSYQNFTESTASAFASGDIWWLYRISYTWYTMIGVITCLLVGILVSLATGCQDSSSVDPALVIPWCEKIKKKLSHRSAPEQYGDVPVKSDMVHISLDAKSQQEENPEKETFI